MPSFKVAHIREQGVDMLVVPLDDSFARRPPNDQRATATELQTRASAAGLAGKVIPVWNDGRGGMAFIAPPKWHPFFKSINLEFVLANVNGELSW